MRRAVARIMSEAQRFHLAIVSIRRQGAEGQRTRRDDNIEVTTILPGSQAVRHRVVGATEMGIDRQVPVADHQPALKGFVGGRLAAGEVLRMRVLHEGLFFRSCVGAGAGREHL